MPCPQGGFWACPPLQLSPDSRLPVQVLHPSTEDPETHSHLLVSKAELQGAEGWAQGVLEITSLPLLRAVTHGVPATREGKIQTALRLQEIDGVRLVSEGPPSHLTLGGQLGCGVLALL